MRSLLVSVLLIAGMGAAIGTANAQPGLSSAPNLDGADNANRIAENARRAVEQIHKTGIEALQRQDFAAAEKSFSDLLSRNPTTTDANYLMGIAKLGLGRWEEAKPFLEKAVKLEPKRPEPKARLGVTYVKLNDTGSAMKQRADLAALASKCGNGCADGPRIAENLKMLDQALAPKPPG